MITRPRWVDGHLDLAYLALAGRDLTVAAEEPGCISLPALRAAGVDVALATIFTAPGGTGAERYPRGDAAAAEACGLAQLAVYERLERAGELTIVRDAADLTRDTPRPRIVLLMEGADPLRHPRSVAAWHERGLRVVGLAWAAGTRYAGGDRDGGGLTEPGLDIVAALDEVRMVHDASHLSARAFDDLVTHAKGRIVATHSNCRRLAYDHDRNLSDEQVRTIGERDGIIGLNLYTSFVRDDGRASGRDAVAHVLSCAKLMGRRDAVGLGSDMDGGFDRQRLPTDVDHPDKLHVLADGLRAAGWSERDVGGFCAGNWLRFLGEAI